VSYQNPPQIFREKQLQKNRLPVLDHPTLKENKSEDSNLRWFAIVIFILWTFVSWSGFMAGVISYFIGNLITSFSFTQYITTALIIIHLGTVALINILLTLEKGTFLLRMGTNFIYIPFTLGLIYLLAPHTGITFFEWFG
jgi:hypothetical protein